MMNAYDNLINVLYVPVNGIINAFIKSLLTFNSRMH